MKTTRAHIGTLWPYAVLIGLPAAAFILPDILGGHLLVTGDNLQQNYPLHVLVGSMYRHGELPFWNQYIFSGTPLLAGFNAGAFYPLRRPLRDPSRSGGVDRHRGDPLLAHRHRHVPLPPGAEAVDNPVRAGCRRVFVLRSRPEPGRPHRHDRGIRFPPVHVAGGGPHRQRRPVAMVRPPRRRICPGHLRRGSRGDARRGDPGPRLRRPERRPRSASVGGGC